MNKLSAFKRNLFKSVDAAVLGYFRIVFGIVMLITYIDVEQYFVNNLSKQKFFFKYDLLEWIQLLPSDQLSILFLVLKISAILFILGVFYRINSFIQFIGWSYLFFSERGHYNNHFYFYAIILLFFCIVDADRWLAIKIKKTKVRTVPYWQLLIFQLQVFIVYFFGGIAKLNADWLLGHPMVNWLGNRQGELPNVLETFISSDNGSIFISYAGLIFDLLIGFLLFSRRFRYTAIIPILVFNVLNHFLWRIGTFPWVMIAATFLFYDPSWPSQILSSVKKMQWKFPSIKVILRSLYAPAPRNLFADKIPGKQRILPLIFICLFFSFQFVFPLRHYAFKGDVAWTGEGHLFSWRMMLSSSDDAVRIRLKFPNDPNDYYVEMFAYMNRGQLNKITKTPKMIIKFIQHIKKEITKKSGVTNMDIHLEMYKSVNFRPPQLLNDTTLNYANIEYNYFKQADWILPWTQTTKDLRTNVKDDAAWKGILFE